MTGADTAITFRRGHRFVSDGPCQKCGWAAGIVMHQPWWRRLMWRIGWVRHAGQRPADREGRTMFDKGTHTYKSDLLLGERYQDETTGLEGHLIAIHLYEHACERGTLRYVNGQQDVCEATFDAPELVHVATGVVAVTAKTGGPNRNTGARNIPSR